MHSAGRRTALLTRWLPLAAWMLVIFLLSHQPGDESKKTSEWVLRLFSWFGIGEPVLLRYHIPFLIRKLAHFTEYFILFLLADRAAEGLAPPQPRWKVWLLCVLYACTDEFHQGFMPGRVPTPVDVAIDAAGAGLGWAVRGFFRRRRA
ncbi:MAG: VanZ family protein [Bacteroidia bacterium]|nr:VanZ family protein [Bacteroidia bacterium]